MAKMSIIFDGFKDLADAIDRSGGDLHKAVNDALQQTQQLIQSNVRSAAAPYAAKGLQGYAKGDMHGSILRDKAVTWKGTVAEVKTGFSANGGATLNGFMHSIFIMYGTPRINKDQKVFNAIKGTKTRNDVAKLQEKIMLDYLDLNGR